MSWVAEELARDRQAHLLREQRVLARTSTQTTLDEQDVVVAASNDYLGLATDHTSQAIAQQVIADYGVGAGGSRATTGTTPHHVALEKTLAQFKQTADALVFSSGYLANLGVLATLGTADTVIFSDALNHASLIDACRLSRAEVVIYPHADSSALATLMAGCPDARQKIIVTDGVFSMDGDLAPLPAIVALAQRHSAWVIVDDAHGTGTIGPGGRGTAAHFGVSVTLTIGTLSKALGSHGGFVCGSHEMIAFLRQRARTYMFETALPAALMAAAEKNVQRLLAQPELPTQLQQLSKRVRDELQALGYTIPAGQTPILPVVIGDAAKAVALSEQLEQHGVLVSAIRPPTVPAGTSRLRLSLSLGMTAADVDQIIAAFRRVAGG